MAEFSFSTDSLFKTKSPSRDEKKAASNPNEFITEKKEVFLTEAFAKPPKVAQVIADTTKSKAADFYREGIPSDIDDQPFNFSPRQIDVFDNQKSGEGERASIRIFGRGQNNKGGFVHPKDQDLIPPYTKFFLESVQESHTERSQIVETFGDFYVFFFGERPPIYNFSGTLMNTQNVNWLGDFMFMYESFLRGTRCVEQNATALITYGGRQIEGFIMSTGNATQSQNDRGVQITFQVLVIDRKLFGLSSDFGVLIQNGKLIEDQGFLDLLGEEGLSRPEVSRAFEKAKETLEGEANPSSIGTVLGGTPTIPTALPA